MTCNGRTELTFARNAAARRGVASPLAPELIAADIAPILDRLRIAITRAIGARTTDLAQQHGLSMYDARVLSTLRNTMPDRIVSCHDLGELFVYSPPGDFKRSLRALVDRGLVERLDEDSLGLTGAGRSGMVVLRERTSALVDELWSAHRVLAESLAPLAQRLVHAAAQSGGPGFRVVAPVYEPPGTLPAMLLAERLTPLRIHRFDSHVAAWRYAGLTVDDMRRPMGGAQRDAIERDTNRRAAAPYSHLDEDERHRFAVGLGALPN